MLSRLSLMIQMLSSKDSDLRQNNDRDDSDRNYFDRDYFDRDDCDRNYIDRYDYPDEYLVRV